jgi:transcription elongation factor Elf1
MAKAHACFRCNSKDHTIKDCPHSDNVCYNCGKEGHIRRNCEATDHDLYGDYMHDIHEGREPDMDRNNKSPEIGEITNDDNTTTNCVFSNESHPVWMCVPFPLLGSMLHTPMLAFGYLCFTFSTHGVTLTIICSVSFLYCVTSFVPGLNTTLSTFSLSTCESDLSNSFWT